MAVGTYCCTKSAAISAVSRAPTAWTMTALPSEVWHCPYGCRNSRIPLGERTIPTNGRDTTARQRRVVSKCALRDKRNGTLGCPNAPRRKFIVLVHIESPPVHQGSWKQRSERPFPVSLPPGSAAVFLLFAPYHGFAFRLFLICAWLAVISFHLWSWKILL